MHRDRNRLAALAVATVAGCAGAAAAQAPAFITFGFTDLNLEYETTDGASGSLTAAPQLNSAGDVTRVGQDSTASFDPGFVDDGGAFDVGFDFNVFDITDTTADADGEFFITDEDGDQIVGNLAGVWTFDPAFDTLEFSGDLIDVTASTSEGDGLFEGTSGESFEIGDGPLGTTVEGALIQLSFAPGNFFAESFDGFNANFSGIIVPAPGAIAIAAVGGLVATRRRR